MIKSLLIILFSTLLISCASNKKSSKSESQELPPAELALAPGHIQVSIEISEVENSNNQQIVTAEVLKVLNYGSAVEPVPTGSMIKFSMADELSEKLKGNMNPGSVFSAVLFNEGSGMKMGNKESDKLWKLITINN